MCKSQYEEWTGSRKNNDENTLFPSKISYRKDSKMAPDQFGYLPKKVTYPFSNPPFCPKKELSVNVTLGDG